MGAYFQSVEGEGRREKDSAVSRRGPATTRESEATSAGVQAVVDRARASAMLAGEARLLELVALGRPLAEVLDALCQLVEELVTDCSCAVQWASCRWPPPRAAEREPCSSWSMPILASSGRALGTLAILRRGPVSCTAAEQALGARFTKLAGIAIERAEVDETRQAGAAALPLVHDRLTQAQRLSHPAAFTMDIEAHEHTWSKELSPSSSSNPRTR